MKTRVSTSLACWVALLLMAAGGQAQTRIFVGQGDASSLLSVSIATGAATSTSLSGKVVAMASGPGGQPVLVATDGGVIDVLDDGAPSSIAVAGVTGLVVDSAADFAYLSIGGDDRIDVLDLQSETVVDTVAVGDAPGPLVLLPDGMTLYVANTGDGTVSVVDLLAGIETETVVVGLEPRAIATSPDGGFVYVVAGDGSLTAIDTSSDTVADDVTGLTDPTTVTVSSTGGRLYVCELGEITVFDAAFNELGAVALGAGEFCGGASLLPGGRYVAFSVTSDTEGTDGPTGSIGLFQTCSETLIDSYGAGAAPGVTLGLPSLSVLISDDFESGDTRAWPTERGGVCVP